MDALDVAIRQYLEKKRLSGITNGRPAVDTPREEDFYHTICGGLDPEAVHRMDVYLEAHAEDKAFVMKMRELLTRADQEASQTEVSDKLLERIKSLRKSDAGALRCPYCRKTITPFKQPLSKQRNRNLLVLIGAVGSFLLSFVFRRYFIQCLVMALFLGIKWIVDRRKTKTQIMIYKVLKEEADEAPADKDQRLKIRDQNNGVASRP